MTHPVTYLATIVFFLILASSPPARAIPSPKRRPSLTKQLFMGPQNAARSLLRMRPLVWDPKLARYARWYANQRRSDCALQHSNGPYGENIFWGSGTGWSPAQAAAAWVSEKKYYNYGSNSCAAGQMCGHYTQVVWKTTTRVGCAKINCYGGKGVFMTCNYDPPGNYIGERPY
ncbi:pathogenesis-related protein PR-1-like [Prosopis cineraria]|uniref:pathogenesis-related protein PR-1-like n=1 Tax=Prosopis cineraria TaxID=364024 RepID=UPI00240F50C4|nr:pathogenesis-related protein PR-1-like [Prosopis cineraria]